MADENQNNQKVSSTTANHTTFFTNEEVTKIIAEVFDTTIGSKQYNFQETTKWNQQCVELVTSELVKQNKPFKYIVISSLLQLGNGAGMNVSTVSFWNKETDHSVSYRWEGKNMLAIVHVFAVNI